VRGVSVRGLALKLVQVAVAVVVLVMRRSTVRRSMTPWTLKTRRMYSWRRSKVWGPIKIFSRLVADFY
jgi:hypothetical protein